MAGLGSFGWFGVCLLLCALSPAWAGIVTLVGTGAGSLVADGTTKIDIVDPENDSVIDTAEWGTAPTRVGPPNNVGTYNTWAGESWARIFDNNTGSKVCCNFAPGTTSFTVTSATDVYSLTGYSLTTGNDDYGRRPDGWRLFGSTDGFATSNDLLDTVVRADINGGTGFTANQQVGEVVLPGPTGGYSSFRMIFDDSDAPNAFQLAEVELIGVLGDFEIGGDNTIGVYQPSTTVQNIVGTPRFVRVSERPGTGTQLHISEIEVFPLGAPPDELGPVTANGNPALSTNDYAASGYDAPTTSTALNHGNPNSVFDGNHESGGGVWSVANGLPAPNPRFTLDLGTESSVGIVRAFPRNDTCCQDRFANLRFEIFADDGTGVPALFLGAIDGPDNAPGGTTAMAEVLFNMPSGVAASADIVGELNAAITYIFEIDALTGTMDLIEIANPSPSVYT
ncbi:hypothetical protein HQ560_22035, partial [bacterium]|nr:hypothetical protein [bacterium]